MVFFNFIQILIEHSVSKTWRLIRCSVLHHLILVCTVCPCPIKRMLGLYGLSCTLKVDQQCNETWPGVNEKLFSCSTQMSMKFVLFIYSKMATIVGILKDMNFTNDISSVLC